MRTPSLAAAVMVSALVAGAAAAQEHHAHARARATSSRPADTSDGSSVSIGRHDRGRLVGGRALRESETLRFNAGNADARFGTDELVGLLERASRSVSARTPGSRLTVGPLSHRSGGRFRPHRSHQSGRDADVAFYTLDPSGAALPLDRFMSFRRDLTVRGHDEIHYDLVRSWQLVDALLTDEVPVQWIFVERTIRERLMEEGARQGASADVLAHAEAVLSQPRHARPHDDHFHVRIYCPPEDRPGCLDDPPLHPWVAGASQVAAAD